MCSHYSCTELCYHRPIMSSVHLKIYRTRWHCCPQLASRVPVTCSTVAHMGLSILPPSQPMHRPEWPTCPSLLPIFCTNLHPGYLLCLSFQTRLHRYYSTILQFHQGQFKSHPLKIYPHVPIIFAV